MKTRKSLSGKDDPGKEALSSLPEHIAINNTGSPSIVRKLRSRVITSDTEEDCTVRSRTPKSNRKVDRERSTSPVNNKEVQTLPSKLKTDVNSEKKTPKRSKRLSTANLFKIEEVKEECESDIKEEPESECVDATYNENEGTNAFSSDCYIQDKETAAVSDEAVKIEPSSPVESEDDTRDVESLNSAPKAETPEKEEEGGKTGANMPEDKPMGEELEEDSENDEVSGAVSFLSSRSRNSPELSMIGEAVRKEKRKRKEYVVVPEQEVEEEGETGANDLVEGEPLGGEIEEDSGSDDDVPEAVSFSSSKSQISSELSMIAEAVRKEKEKRKERVRKKIEMIRIQKAEKEERRKQKMKFVEINVPEKLPEDIASGLPDKPDIPTVKKSISCNKKRKSEEKTEKLAHRDDEKKNKILKFDDYIPITDVAGTTQFGVVPLEVTSRLPKPSSQSAAEFKRNALFGSRIRREPSKNLLVYRQKLSAAGKLQKSFTSSSLLKI